MSRILGNIQIGSVTSTQDIGDYRLSVALRKKYEKCSSSFIASCFELRAPTATVTNCQWNELPPLLLLFLARIICGITRLLFLNPECVQVGC